MSTTPAPTVVAGLTAALARHLPFSELARPELERIVRGSSVRYFAAGDVILAADTQRPAHCYVVREGSVRSERPGLAEASLFEAELGAGEMFPLGALVAGRGVTGAYRAVRDTFCIVFPAAIFDELLQRSAAFRDYCTRRLAHLLDLLREQVQHEYVTQVTEQRGFHTPLADLVRLAPVVAVPDEALAAVLERMEVHRIGSLPVVDDAGRPLGMFTRQDVIGRIVLPQRPLATPVRDVMSAPAITLPGTATAGDAALQMAHHGFRHVVVVDPVGRLSGVVSERDLFGLQRLSARELTSTIRRAPDLRALIQCAADIRSLSHALVSQGIASGKLTRMIAALNDQLTARLLAVTAPAFEPGALALCWLGMGSEGRSEQTIATDQDNGLMFVAAGGEPAEAVRARLLPFARAVNEGLDRCGFPLCKGGIMAMNAQWCRSADEWHAIFAQWIDRGDPESLLRASIFFDFRPLWGDPAPALALRAAVARDAMRNVRFLKQMADNAQRWRLPLNWRGEIATSGKAGGADEGIDVKLYGSAPVTDAARVMALASGVTATNTVDRLQAAGVARKIPGGEVTGWCDAFEYLQMLRLRVQHRRAAGELPPADNPNLVPMSALSDLDRRILKQALRQVRGLRQRLMLDYA